jgi:hypothetical protein
MQGSESRSSIAWMLAVQVVLACSKEAKTDGPSDATASAESAPSSAERVPAPPPAPAAPLGCRAMKSSGEVKLEDGTLLEPKATLDGKAWLELGDGSELWLKHTASGRELSLKGPALVRPCSGGREELVVAHGRVVTSTGTGARPGAEVLIASPAGAVRYGNAELEFESRGGKLTVQVRTGEAWIEPADPARKLKTNPLRAKDKLSLPRKLAVQALLEHCQKLAEAAQASAGRVLAPAPDAGNLGERAAVQVRDRRAARAACSIAAAATGQVADRAERERLWRLVERSEALWQGVPSMAGDGNARP